MNRMKGAACAAVGVVALGAAIFWQASGDARTGAQGRADAAAPVVATPAQPVVVSTPLPPLMRAGAAPGLPAGAASAGQPAAPHPSGDELFAYSTTDTPHREGPYTFYPVDIDVDQVLASALSGRLTFTAPDGSQIALDYDRHLTHEDGNWTWMGRETGGTASQDAVITFGPDATFGSLPSSNGQQLRITTIQGKTYVTSASFSQLQAGIREGGDTVVKAADAAVAASAASGVVTAAATAVTAPPVDVVIGYSTTYRVSLGSTSAVTTRLTNLIDTANRALSNSAVTTAAFRLVGTLEVAYADNSDNGVALSDLASTSASSPLAAMRAARAQYGADLVSFVRKYTTGQNGCGLAYIPQAPYASTGRDQTFSVVGDGSIDMGGGVFSYCPDSSLAHEMGHNLGAQHNSQTNSTGGLYAYSYGYRDDTNNFYDIMSYGLGGQEPELLYSTPGVSTCKGLPCGVANVADVARTFRETLTAAATFRATVVPLPDSSQPGQVVGANGRCLDVVNGGTAPGTSVQVWACNSLRQQQWLQSSASGAFASMGTSVVLDATGYGVGNGTPMQVWSATGASNQRWYFARAVLVANGGRVLDAVNYGTANGTQMQLWDSLGGTNQRWTFDPITGQIQNETGRCLDVVGYGTANGTALQLWDCTGTSNQKFRFGSNGSLIGIGGNCLDAVNYGTANGTRLQMWTCTGATNQRWRIRGEIRGFASNLCLDDSGGGARNGALTQLWQCLRTANQQWEYQPN